MQGNCEGFAGARAKPVAIRPFFQIEPHIPPARWRLRIWNRPSRLFFCPSGRDQRGPSGRALSGLSRPQRRRRSAFSASGLHLNPLGYNLMYNSNLVQWGLNGIIAGLQGPHQDSQLECIEIRSTPRVKWPVLDLYSMKVHSENIRVGPNTNRCTFTSAQLKSLTRAASQSGVERAMKN